MTSDREILEYVILHPFDSPFFNRRTRAITISDYSKSGLHTIFVSNSFYPALFPETGELVSLTVTTSSISDKIRDAIGKRNEIVLINPHETKIENNYVSYGKISKFNLPDNFFDLYIDALNISLSLERPLVLLKDDGRKTRYVPVSAKRYFHISSRMEFGRENADCSYNIILLKFTTESFRYACRKSVLSVGARRIETVNVNAFFLAFDSSGSKLLPIELTMEYGIYKPLSQSGDGLYIGHVYTIYNIKRDEVDIPERNILVRLAFFDYTMDSIASFANPQLHSGKVTTIATTSKRTLRELRKKIMYGLPESILEITSKNKLRKVVKKDETIDYIFLSPKFVFRLLKAYIGFPQYRSLIESIISSDDPISLFIQFSNSVEDTGFYNGNLIDRALWSYLIN
ncbi:MAG: hypothetical protein QXU18_06635 [Thermoplasmatales archaeon]